MSSRGDRIALRHGAGGRAMRELIEGLLIDPETSVADGVGPAAMDDGAAIRVGDQWLVVTTDAHVVKPIFFSGGDIGRLAVSGVVNDLAMMGATNVLALACAVILEEGFERAALERVVASVRATCKEAGAPIVTGDTKVMPRSEVDGIVLTTTGVALTSRLVTDRGLRPGDRIVVTGTIGDHGLAVLARRHDLSIQGDLRSDVAPINTLIRGALSADGGDGITALKDPTRGGVASALHEMASKSGVGIVVDDGAVPVSAAVRAAAELVGIDPLHVANEGKAVLGVAPSAVDDVLRALREHPLGRQAAVIGTCTEDQPGRVIVETGFGRRLLTELDGEPMPRIC